MLYRRYVEVDRDPLAVTANDHEIKRLVGVDVQLLMRHIRREVDEIARTHLGDKLEPLSPTDTPAPFHDVNRHLMTPMVMRTGLCMGRQRDGADPRFSSPGTGEIKCGRATCAGGSKRRSRERASPGNLHAVGAPSRGLSHHGSTIDRPRLRADLTEASNASLMRAFAKTMYRTLWRIYVNYSERGRGARRASGEGEAQRAGAYAARAGLEERDFAFHDLRYRAWREVADDLDPRGACRGSWGAAFRTGGPVTPDDEAHPGSPRLQATRADRPHHRREAPEFRPRDRRKQS